MMMMMLMMMMLEMSRSINSVDREVNCGVSNGLTFYFNLTFAVVYCCQK